MRAVLAGATGLVGSRVLARLRVDPAWREIVVLARRAVPEAGRAQVRQVDFERLAGAARSACTGHSVANGRQAVVGHSAGVERSAGVGRPARTDHLAGSQDLPGTSPSAGAEQAHTGQRLEDALRWAPLDVAFCCLGTTIRAAGSQAAFARVDRDYVLAFARRAREAGATRLAVVSAAGASAASPVFYSRIKGEVEHALRAMDWPSLTILRPSLLDGERREFRAGERAALAVMRPLRAIIPARWRAVPADAVAAAMVALARRGEPGVRVVESEEIAAIAAGRDRGR